MTLSMAWVAGPSGRKARMPQNSKLEKRSNTWAQRSRTKHSKEWSYSLGRGFLCVHPEEKNGIFDGRGVSDDGM